MLVDYHDARPRFCERKKKMFSADQSTIIRLIIFYLFRKSILNQNVNNQTEIIVSFRCDRPHPRSSRGKNDYFFFIHSFRIFQNHTNLENVLVAQNLWPIVVIPHLGILKGRLTSSSHRRFYEFRGIKYAKAPNGKNRFKPPIPIEPWDGIRNAENYAKNCSTLKSLRHLPESERHRIDLEDCLNLDVYTSNTNFIEFKSNTTYPVMVYVHGGSFRNYNSPDFLPHYLMKRKIVLVVMNYRLDALGKLYKIKLKLIFIRVKLIYFFFASESSGFLSTMSSEIPGNAGVLDAILALKWVKSNIEYFGGNNQEITLFGQSSGAVMVSSMVISPIVPKNLFNKVIIQSGSVLAPWAIAKDPVTYAIDIARRVNASLADAPLSEINKAFMEMSSYDLLEATEQHYVRQV